MLLLFGPYYIVLNCLGLTGPLEQGCQTQFNRWPDHHYGQRATCNCNYMHWNMRPYKQSGRLPKADEHVTLAAQLCREK